MVHKKDLFSRGFNKFTTRPLFFIFIISFLLRAAYLALDYPLWWDAHVYIGIGKYIFSGGELGIWESFRPLVHPLVLGSFWKLGFNPFVMGKLLDLLFSMLAICFVYLIGQRIFNKRTAIVASIVFSLTPMYIMFTGLILADPLALAVGLGGIYLLISRRSRTASFFGGILLGFSFLTRFPQGIWFGAVFLAFLWRKEKWGSKFYGLAVLSLGFCLPVLPYLVFNYFRYQNILEPFIAGSWIVSTATWLYGSGMFYYFTHFFLVNPIYLFFFSYAYFFFKRKEWEKPARTLIFVIPFFVLLYFLTVPRKEVRYLAAALPFLAMISSFALTEIYQALKRRAKPIITAKAFLVIVAVVVLLPLPTTLHIERAPTFEQEVKKIVMDHHINGTILSSDPSFVSFLDLRIVTLDGMEFAATIYQQQQGKYELLFVNDCDLVCEPGDISCEGEKQELLTMIDKENREVFFKEFRFRKKVGREARTCTYLMYLPNNP